MERYIPAAERAASKLKEAFGDSILDVRAFRGETTVTVSKERILEVNRFLRDDPELSFDCLVDLCGVDNLAIDQAKKTPYRVWKPVKLGPLTEDPPEGAEPRFMIVYHLYSFKNNDRLRVKAPVGSDDCAIDSMVPLWKAANWYEREAWDMYGVEFKGHPDLRRILSVDDFEGFPLRKDFPLRGKRGVGADNSRQVEEGR